MAIDLNTLFLFIGMINASIICGLLLFRKTNRTAHIILASLVGLLVMRVLFYWLGKDGIYDPHSWLYQPPIEFSMAYGPLIYAYVNRLTHHHHAKFWPHLFPFLLQIGYYISLLLMPKADAAQWIQNTHFNAIADIESICVITSMTLYLFLCWRRYSTYLKDLKQQRSDVENFRLPWLFGFLLATSLTMVCIAFYSISALWLKFNYTQHFWLFASQSVLLFYVSIESWKHGDIQTPQLKTLQSTSTPAFRDLNHQHILKAESWLQAIKANQWWKDPELTLQTLAKKLGSNSTTVSKVINSGLNKNFNTLINELRVAAVCDCIEQGLGDGLLLQTAFSMGFNSKNSFNRNFKKITGHTPQQHQKLRAPNHKLLN